MKRTLFTVLMLLLLNHPAAASVCKITGQKGNWGLEVDGKPFALKGAGCADITGLEGADYFKLALEMGVNTIRTWGIDQGTETYLNTAEKYGLKVDAGIWMPHCNFMREKKVFSYLGNSVTYPGAPSLEALEEEALAYVAKYKDHPAILMWNVGNETLFFTNEDEERVAFCKYLEKIVQKIKVLDPDHPVLYTLAGTSMLPYLAKYVPSLDIIGINTYGGVDTIPLEMAEQGLNKPFLITEAGPRLPLDRPKDEFGRSVDEADYEKAFHYQYLLEEIEKVKGSCLGGFVFYLGETTQESLTWWNITYGPYLRESYHTIAAYYTGKTLANKPPLCTDLTLDKTLVAPGEKMTATIKAWDREKDDLQYKIKVGTSKENLLIHRVNEEIPIKVLNAGPVTEFQAPAIPGIYKLHAFVLDGHQNVSTRTVAFKVEG